MKATLACGFVYGLEWVNKRTGHVFARDVVRNLVPIEGLHYLINSGLRNQPQNANFYVGLYEGNYTPVPADVMATFPTDATELTAYSESTRRALTLGVPSAGSVDNSAAKAEFTGTTDGKLVQGGFISSVATKGSGSGVLMSAVRFPSPKALDAGTILRVTAGFNFVSL